MGTDIENLLLLETKLSKVRRSMDIERARKAIDAEWK